MGYSAPAYILSTGANNYRQSCKTVEKSCGFSPITILPDCVSNLSSVKKVACGREHTMILLKDGRLYGIGHNQHGQIYGKEPATFTSFYLIPSFVEIGDKIVDVFCTQINTYVVTAHGCIYWSGWENSSVDKTYLRLHTSTISPSLRIDRFVTNSNAVHCFVISGSNVYGTGWNSNGQLGVGNRSDSYGTLALVPFDARKIKCISTGAQFSVLSTETELFGCGTNGDLQLSTAYNGGSEIFTQITTPFSGRKIRNVVCGGFHTIVQLENNEIWGTGKYITNEFSKLNINEPVCAIGAGWQFYICLGESGKMYVAGENNNGQLGTDEFESTSTLTTVTTCRDLAVTNRTLLECGEFYSIAYLDNNDKSHLFTYSILKKISNGIACFSDIEIKAFH